ncbi:Protein kinase domain-containing protein [Abditibacterium utsteinense]|uniref:Protein kinase domain-containing protein n=1 Tax=Abditibacterium utsteinense TaxID=1960156 RepID=A0A2S8SS05_9BACT|nr:serine/threonine protein kinase [Abditibacterium utsteinense]PQV63580.1 Protein kinase domain-containing protein [Abditibacterium utsteinense]
MAGSKTVLYATLESGQVLEYLPEVIGEGGMKVVHFTPDKKSVVCFFKDSDQAVDPQRRVRLQNIVGKYNPTTDAKTGAYWKDLFCWPTAVVVKPQLGVVAPTYAANFFFASGPFQGKEKQATWFTSPKLRRMLPVAERGTWLGYLQISIRLARAVRRMHNAGLAHSDLSNKNVLIDPLSGAAVIIDVDSLVVPQIYPPDVLGTPGYIAPEVLATSNLALDDSKRVLPSRRTDQHALAVLIYQYLLGRHPLRGPKVNSTISAEEDERISMGEGAVWVENPTDRSNRPAKLGVPYSVLGPYLSPLLERAFMSGLHNPGERPGADEWERALVKTTDLLLPCPNASCSGGWFVLGETAPRCPWCGTLRNGSFPVLNLYRAGKTGQFLSERHKLVVWHHSRLYKWHTFDNQFAGEGVDRAPQAYFALQNGVWWMVNQGQESMSITGAGSIPPGGGTELRDGQQIQLSNAPHGRLAVVQMMRA